MAIEARVRLCGTIRRAYKPPVEIAARVELRASVRATPEELARRTLDSVTIKKETTT